MITISREFSSGGRELGIAAIAKASGMDEGCIEKLPAALRFRMYPITIARTLSYPSFSQQNEINLPLSRQQVVKRLAAQGNCIMMRQGADHTLREYGR